MDTPILLAAVNARYSHAALGARFLLANMGDLRGQTELMEFTLGESAETIADRIAGRRPRIIGLSVYIWNRTLIETLLPLLRTHRPEARIALGGPEITYDCDSPLARSADVVVRGEGEIIWPDLCRAWMNGRDAPRLPAPAPPPPAGLALPDAEYTDVDLAHRNLYIEASRGCPFACDFCLSAVAPGVRRFPVDAVRASLQRLLDRGGRRFRFVDRSFNTGGADALALLDFFLARLRPGLRLHFEMTPDGLGPDLRERLLRFPPGVLHIETGVQSFDAAVLRNVRRRGDPDRAAEGITWLARTAHADVHADLIAGLPGETPAGFQAGFDRLVRLDPAEIQVGVLKKLHGAPLERHVKPFAMHFRATPPYDVLETRDMPAKAVRAVRRFAAHWERIVTRGHFPAATARMLAGADSPWTRFDAFSRRLADRCGLHGFGLVESAAEMLEFMAGDCGIPRAEARDLLERDYRAGGKRSTLPRFLRPPDLKRRTKARMIRR